MKKMIRIGTRDSRLAMWQAEYVKNVLASLNPNVTFTLVPMKTKGDKILDIPLPKIGDKGLFTKELEQGLLCSEIDMAVHSLKDLPTELPEGLEIAAFCQREEPRDVFLSTDGIRLEQLPPGSVIGTSSLRRKAQLQNYRPDFVFEDLRGNLDTRWRKLQESQEMKGIVLAAAGVIRLGWKDRITEFLSVDVVLPAAGQGVVAVEIASNHTEIRGILEPINHRESELAVRAERAFLGDLEGGCQVPVGALATVSEGKIILNGMVASLDGLALLRVSAEGHDPETTGLKAGEMIKAQGAERILAEIRG